MSFCEHSHGQRFDRAQVLRALRQVRSNLRGRRCGKKVDEALCWRKTVAALGIHTSTWKTRAARSFTDQGRCREALELSVDRDAARRTDDAHPHSTGNVILSRGQP